MNWSLIYVGSDLPSSQAGPRRLSRTGGHLPQNAANFAPGL